ncbi:MAG: two-component response regulator [Micavibrio sp.]|nr:two-component response regulator [Micavibrio sp.]
MLMQNRGRELDFMVSATFQFRTMEEAHTLSLYLANCFPEPERVVNGLTELMFNAIEHGNLGIGYQMKAELSQQNLLATEVAQRLQSPVLGERVAEVTMARKDGGIYIVITDQGEGFDWKDHIKINPSRAGKTSGRGIAMANSISFDKLTYNEKGNTAVAFVAESSDFSW